MTALTVPRRGGRVLRVVRTRIGLTQEQVCEMMDWPLRTYQRWESEESEPPFSAIVSACTTAFQIPVNEALTIAEKSMTSEAANV